MPFKLSIEADNLVTALAALQGVTRALTEETGPVVTSDQAPSDIVQHPELPFSNGVENSDQAELGRRVEEAAGANAPLVEPEPAPAPKKRGRPPKASHPVQPVVVEDIEPPPEVITEEEEPEAEGAVDAPEPQADAPTGVTEQMLRDLVRDAMDEHGIPKTLLWMGKAGYQHVRDIPPAEYDQVYAILKSRGVLDA